MCGFDFAISLHGKERIQIGTRVSLSPLSNCCRVKGAGAIVLPVPNAQRTAVLIQNDFREIMTFSTDSEQFQNNFCIDSETFLNQSRIHNQCFLNFSKSEENSESVSKLALNQNESQKTFSTLQA